jgi:AcrR family transcriptional regulator
MSKVRREPRQQRSKERVDQVLAATAEIISEGGIEALTMNAISARSRIPTPTLYRYFSDRDEIAAAFLDAELEKIDLAIAEAFLALERVTIRAIVETAMFAHLKHHQDNPNAVQAWFKSPRAPVVHRRVKDLDAKMGKWFRDATMASGLIDFSQVLRGETLLVELGDRTFEWLFTQDLTHDEQNQFVGQFVDMLASYLERFATPAGLDGIPGPEFFEALGRLPQDSQEPGEAQA